MNSELNHLLGTSGPEMREAVSRDLSGFKKLFDKFVTKSGVSVDWDKIEKPPSQSVDQTEL